MSLTIEEKIDLAISSKDTKILEKLSIDLNVNVRTAVAKNRFISKKIANTLAYDPVVNVSYFAIQNNACTINRKNISKEVNKCVLCTLPEYKKLTQCSTC